MPPELMTAGLAPARSPDLPVPSAPDVRRASVVSTIQDGFLPAPRRVVDQRVLPCCVSCALGAALEILHPTWPPLAPVFHYHVARFVRSAADGEGALILESAIAILRAQGICRFEDHPKAFTEQEAKLPPATDAFRDAIRRRPVFQPSRLRAVSRAAAVRDQIRARRPVVVGLRLPATYPESFPGGPNRWLDPIDNLGLRHCVVVLGYSDSERAFQVQDSRGSDRFENGCWWLGYRIMDSSAVEEAWAIQQ